MKAAIIWGSVAVIGLVLVVGGAVLGWVAGPAFVKSMVKKQMDLTDPESDGYKYFIEPPVPVLIKFTFFEVSNYEDVNSGTAKPMLVERGPYTYREDRIKKDLEWANDTRYLNFGQYKDYTFEPEKSCTGCTEDDTVRILNMPLAGLIATLVNMGGRSGQGGLNAIDAFSKLDTTTDELFHETKVADFLFRGIKTGFAEWMMTNGLFKNRLPPVFTEENGFAMFNRKVNTAENECYQVETSAESWERHSMITKWGKDNESLSEDLASAQTCSWTGEKCKKWWPVADFEGNTGANSTCNQVMGTDGQQFPPFVNKKDQEDLWIFNTLPCRSIFMRYSDKVKIEGISALEYTVPEDGANINKKINVCTCKELSDMIANNVLDTNNNTCVKDMTDDPNTLDISSCPPITNCYDGLQDITVCQGAPTFMSYPHFYLAPIQQAKFDGLSPDKEAHKTFLNVEPNTGTSLRLHSRVQLNIPVYNYDDLPYAYDNGTTGPVILDMLKHITSVPAFPILWIDEGADIDSDPEMIKKLKKQLVTPLAALNIGKWVMIGLGVAITVLGVAFTFVKCR